MSTSWFSRRLSVLGTTSTLTLLVSKLFGPKFTKKKCSKNVFFQDWPLLYLLRKKSRRSSWNKCNSNNQIAWNNEFLRHTFITWCHTGRKIFDIYNKNIKYKYLLKSERENRKKSKQKKNITLLIFQHNFQVCGIFHTSAIL